MAGADVEALVEIDSGHVAVFERPQELVAAARGIVELTDRTAEGTATIGVIEASPGLLTALLGIPCKASRVPYDGLSDMV